MEFSKFILLSGLIFLTACERSPERPKLTKLNDYDDCILLYMGGVSSDVAARAIHKSCEEQSKKSSLQNIELPPDSLSKLAGSGSIYTDKFNGKIYNGNPDWIITRITMQFTPDSEQLDSKSSASRNYAVDVNIAPWTIEDFSFSIIEPELSYSWSIVKLQGIKVQ